MSILKALFGLGKLKVVPAHRITGEILNKLSSQLGKLMFIIKSNKLKLTKKQSDYIMNQSKQIAEAEKRLFKEVPVKPDAKVYKFPEGGVHNVPVAKQFTRPASDYPHLKGTKGHPDVIDIPEEVMLEGITGRFTSKGVKEVTDPFKTGEIRWILNRANKEGLFAFKPEELKIIKGGRGDLTKIFKDYYGNKALKNLPGEGSVTSAAKYHKNLKNAVDEQGFPADHPQFNKEKIIFPDDLASGGIAGQLHLNQGGRIGYRFGEEVEPEQNNILENLTQEEVDKDPERYAQLLIGLRKPDSVTGEHGSERAWYIQPDGSHISVPWGWSYTGGGDDYFQLIDFKKGGRVSYTKGGLARILGV